MLFNSLAFAIFFPVVFFLYWFVTGKNLKLQNILLFVASSFFYACWDYRFMFLLLFSICLDYFSGLKMQAAATQKARRFWFWLSIIINLGFLCVFKYYNFFMFSFSDLLSGFGIKADFFVLKIILPVGISFYTFHGLSYVIDIYKGRISAVSNFIDYAVFVSFFPLLVAGPIERATHLLPQIQKPRVFDYTKAIDGLRQILWGLFKKIVIADGCAVFANNMFDHSSSYSGAPLMLGAVFFAFQIYCDFSGYSDIALGLARLMGIELLRNFAFPYFSRDIAEFWRRWHISLSSWFRDYLYIPLGGSKGGTWMKVRNTFIIFLVSGFWHGANWTFIFWGFLNALYFMPLLLLKKNRANVDLIAPGRALPSWRDAFAILTTFALTVFAWIFFRANNMSHAFGYIKNMLAGAIHRSLYLQALNMIRDEIGLVMIFLILVFICVEWVGRNQRYALAEIGTGRPKLLRHAFYYGLIIAILYFAGPEQQFIYFQF